MSFKPVDPKVDFPKQEEEVLKFWQDNDIFKKSVSQREGAEDFVFFFFFPFATGLPHFGHFIPSTIKDIIPRYQTMKGKRVERRFGWDCHGLPIENLIEKELNILKLWVSTNSTMPAVLRFSAIQASGDRLLPVWAAGLILITTTRQ